MKVKITDLKQNKLHEGNIIKVDKKGSDFIFYSKAIPFRDPQGRVTRRGRYKLTYVNKSWTLKILSRSYEIKTKEKELDLDLFWEIYPQTRIEAEKKNMFVLDVEPVVSGHQDIIVKYIMASKRPYSYGYIRKTEKLLELKQLKKKGRDDDIASFILRSNGFLYSTHEGLLGFFDADKKRFTYKDTDLYLAGLYEVDEKIFACGAGSRVYEVKLENL